MCYVTRTLLSAFPVGKVFPNMCLLQSFLDHLFYYERKVKVLGVQLCPALCDPMDYSPPGSSVRGLFQARTLEQVAVPSCRGSSRPRDRIHISYVSCMAGKFFTVWATREAYIILLKHLNFTAVGAEYCALYPLKFFVWTMQSRHTQGRWTGERSLLFTFPKKEGKWALG